MSATAATKQLPITAKTLKEQLEPFLEALNNLYDELLEKNQSSDIFSIDDSSKTLEEEEVETETKAVEDNSIMTVTKFLGLVKKKITQDKDKSETERDIRNMIKFQKQYIRCQKQ
jgi:hypothetical protein